MLHCTVNVLRSPGLWLFSHLHIYTSYTRINDDRGGVCQYASLQRLRGRDVVANSKMKIISLKLDKKQRTWRSTWRRIYVWSLRKIEYGTFFGSRAASCFEIASFPALRFSFLLSSGGPGNIGHVQFTSI
jgi:hypothetical protein